ncbi:MAG TPA: NAD(P)-dependent oxidoreductase [Flavipsychrobacter sp.]|nr:NAD(P)-dependent oxidoreductase [Flavipsychrobacter sp.]
MKNVLILGGSGFIGQSILQKMICSDEYSIMAVQHRSMLHNLHGCDNICIVRSSLADLDISNLPVIPDVIIHAARSRTEMLGRVGRYGMAMKGQIDNKRLITQVQNINKSIKVIYISGSLVYGNHSDMIVTEHTDLSPISFAREYVHAEYPFFKAAQKGNANVALIRIPWVIGLGSWFKWYYTDVMNKYGFVPIYGAGYNMMTFMDVDYLATAVSGLCHTDFKGILNLYHPKYLLQCEWADLLSRISKMEIKRLDERQCKTFGKAALEAFNTDVCLSSVHKDIQDILLPQQPELEVVIANYLRKMLRDKPNLHYIPFKNS